MATIDTEPTNTTSTIESITNLEAHPSRASVRSLPLELRAEVVHQAAPYSFHELGSQDFPSHRSTLETLSIVPAFEVTAREELVRYQSLFLYTDDDYEWFRQLIPVYPGWAQIRHFRLHVLASRHMKSEEEIWLRYSWQMVFMRSWNVRKLWLTTGDQPVFSGFLLGSAVLECLVLDSALLIHADATPATLPSCLRQLFVHRQLSYLLPNIVPANLPHLKVLSFTEIWWTDGHEPEEPGEALRCASQFHGQLDLLVLSYVGFFELHPAMTFVTPTLLTVGYGGDDGDLSWISKLFLFPHVAFIPRFDNDDFILDFLEAANRIAASMNQPSELKRIYARRESFLTPYYSHDELRAAELAGNRLNPSVWQALVLWGNENNVEVIDIRVSEACNQELPIVLSLVDDIVEWERQ